MEACPKCSFALAPEAVECPSCGVILTKLKAVSGLQRPIRSAPPPLSPLPPLALASNPYAPPVAPVEGAVLPAPAQNLITWPTLEALAAMRPWIRFLAVCGLVLNSLTLLVALGLLFWGGEKPDLMTMALIYLVVSGVGFAIIAPLNRSAKALAGLSSQGAGGSLESFASEQVSFWRRLGVFSIAYLVILGVAVVLGLMGALAYV